MKKRSAKTKCPCLRPLALSAAMLLGPALPALAQSFSQSGTNGTSPNNLLPYSGSPTSLDFTGDAVYIGSGAIGSFSVLAGALLKADSLSVGTGGNGIGTFTASGRNASTLAPSTVQLGALDIGSWGVGTATVSNGGLIDATFCSGPSAGCSSGVGNAAGSTGTLTVTGAGSEVRTARNFTVGQTAVFTLAADGFVFGTPGGTTNATVNVFAGGTLRTEGAVVGRNSASTSGNGNEKAIGTVTVSGSGSSWNVGHNSIDNAASGMTIGANVGGQGSVVVGNGGSLRLDASNGAVNGNDFISIGVAGGKGSLTISGAGSNLTLMTSGAIQAGRSNGSGGVVGDGSFSVLAGATASATFLNVGRDGANGTVLLDGTGSTLTLSGMGPYASGGVGAAVGTIGWVGTGKVTVSNGALWQINDGGADTSANGGRGPGLTIGTVGGTGTVEIKGSGALVSLTSSSITPDPGNPDNANPYVNLGIGAGSSGTLDISDGGKLLLHGDALSTPTHGRTTALSIGGNSDTTPGGIGIVNVSGSGSEIRMTGADAYVVVGRGGTGTLNLSDGALLEATIINLGRVGNATMTMDAANVELAGQFTDNISSGAAVSIGNRGGTASLSMANASTMAITNLGSAGASFNLGGTSPNPLGTGTLTMTGGSQITVTAASGLASASIGRDGSGTVTMQGSSRFDIGDGTLHIGRLPTGTGMLSIESGSTFLTGVANIGGSSDTDAGGMGSVVVQGLGSELNASGASGFVGVGRNGTGTLTLSDQAKLSAIITAVGRGNGGIGTLTASNATLELAGQQTAGLMSGASMSIGSGGGSGSATLSNSTVSITNMGSAGATLNVGGSGAFPGGTGTLVMTNSQVTVTAAAGQGTVSIGRTGSGTAVLDNSSITNVGGNVYVARETGSTGVLALTNGSTVTADFVGIGVSAKYDGLTQATSGTGVLVLNDSTLRTAGFELGAGSVLTGNGGTIEIIPSSGDVVIGGTIAPGNSPGRLRIRCNIIMLPGSRIVLEVQGTGDFYEIDDLIIDSASSFDLASAQIEFSFLGDTNPNQFAALGGMNLDNFFRAETGTTTTGLSTVFAPGQTWSNVVDTAAITATSSIYAFTEFRYSGDGNITLSAVPVPEPSTWGLMFAGLAAVGAWARRRKALAVQA